MANFDPHNPEESLTSHKDPQEGGKNTSLATPSGEPKKRSPRYQVRALVGSYKACLLYTSPSPRDRTRSRMPSSA